jgi:hypothetical protein
LDLALLTLLASGTGISESVWQQEKAALAVRQKIPDSGFSRRGRFLELSP